MAIKIEDLDQATATQEQPPRSLNSKVKVNGIKFTNAATTPIKMFWFDWKGNPVSYGVVQPGSQMSMNTYVTHPWKATGMNGEAMLINDAPIWHPAAADANTEVFISPPAAAAPKSVTEILSYNERILILSFLKWHLKLITEQQYISEYTRLGFTAQSI